MKYATTIGERTFRVEVVDDHHIILDGKPYEVDFTAIANQPVFSLIINGQSLEAHAAPREDGWQILLHGRMFEARVEDEQAIRVRSLAHAAAENPGEYQLRAPMPGLVVGIPVAAGGSVAKGDTLVILESMKMQNELRSLKDGVVQEIRIQPGQTVEQNQVLIVVG
ncbi:MAG: biotin/lipoyl-containing protein [Anaerolineales bacterium]